MQAHDTFVEKKDHPEQVAVGGDSAWEEFDDQSADEPPPVDGEPEQTAADPDEAILQELRETSEDDDSDQKTHRPGLDRITFGITAVMSLAFVVWGFAGTESLSRSSESALGWVLTNTGWAFIMLASVFVIFVLWLALGRFGNIPLGKDGEKPEFRTISWIAMMFSAGMGIGLMFYGTAEPLSHYIAPPPGSVAARTPEAMQMAMATSLFHWSLHPWAMYAIVGIAVAYGSFRKGRSQLLSSVFIPLFGAKHANGPAGRCINILAIFATLFGTAASLGLGALQIGSGLQLNGWADTVTTPILVVIIGLLTACFVASAVSGIAKGIQRLANINMVLAIVLAIFVFVVGPTLFILNLIPAAAGDYARDMAAMAARTEAVGDESLTNWLSTWTIFYWAWWISWSPFVGMFIARISRGRTIRQFVTGVLLVPSLVSVVWFSIFGGAGLSIQQSADRTQSTADGLVKMVDGEPTVSSEGALFQLLQSLPMPGGVAIAAAVLTMVLVAIFFITGADSASLVMASLAEHGREEPSKRIVIFFGVLTGAVAAVMLLAGGSNPAAALDGLQRITIVAALPFLAVMVLICIALVKDLRHDPLALRKRLAESVVERAIRTGVDEHGGEQFDLVTNKQACDSPLAGNEESHGKHPPAK